MTTPVVYRSLVHHHRFIVCAVYSHFFSPRQSSLDDPVVGGRHHHLHCIITAQFFISLKYFMSTIIPRIFLCCSYFFSSVASPNNPTGAAVVIYAHAKRITKVEKLLRMGDSSSFHPPGWSLPPTRHTIKTYHSQQPFETEKSDVIESPVAGANNSWMLDLAPDGGKRRGSTASAPLSYIVERARTNNQLDG